MKTIHIFCASQAATTTMDYSDIHHHHHHHHHHPSSSSTTATATATASRAIDRHNPIIQDQKRLTKTIPTPPTTTTNHHNTTTSKKKPKTPKTTNDQKRKTSAFADENNDEHIITINNNNNNNNNINNHVVRRQGGVLLRWGCTRPGDFISPANSSRFLLTDKALSDQFDPLLKQVSPPPPPPPPPPPAPEKAYKHDNDKSLKKVDGDLASSPVKTPPRSSSSLSSQSSDQQVVVLRVSLHCRGCERKMRKHISKMEGVTSFNIDFMAKKVTVVGDITPLAVLASVSKVKNAKLLSPTTISSQPAPPTDLNFSEIKKQLGIVA